MISYDELIEMLRGDALTVYANLKTLKSIEEEVKDLPVHLKLNPYLADGQVLLTKGDFDTSFKFKLQEEQT